MRSLLPRFAILLLFICLVAGVGFLSRDRWRPLLHSEIARTPAHDDDHDAQEQTTVYLSDEAYATLGIQTAPIERTDYRKTITVPGMVIDLPGHSDHGVPAPVTGIVAKLHVAPGDVVRAGDPLVTIRIISDAIQSAQSDLYLAVQNRDFVRAELKRLTKPNLEGTIAETQLIELRNQEKRHLGTITALRHGLMARGISKQQVDDIEEGIFVKEVRVTVPEHYDTDPQRPTPEDLPPLLEVQELRALLGQQVNAGQLVVSVSNHQKLLVEARAYREEVPAVEHAAKLASAVKIEFGPNEIITSGVRSIGNTMDPVSRTVPFYLPLPNTPIMIEANGRRTLSWKHWPGQRVRVEVPVETIPDVIKLPIDAVVREAGEAYVFRQNDTLFNRKPVRVLHESRNEIVIAPSPELPSGSYIALRGAAALNRVLKSQSTQGSDGGHWHADGTYHPAGH
jgi:membrane fusion protein, heavy metal efflux system